MMAVCMVQCGVVAACLSSKAIYGSCANCMHVPCGCWQQRSHEEDRPGGLAMAEKHPQRCTGTRQQALVQVSGAVSGRPCCEASNH